MADNYIERQREEYEARKAALLNKNKALKKKRKSNKLSDKMEEIREDIKREHL